MKTSLYDLHLASNGKMVDFAGYKLPINYGSQLVEHQAVRNSAGMFDVSHMVVSDISGKESKQFLQYLLANDVAKLTQEGKALYSCMLNKEGGIIDDLIIYWLGNDNYRIISNAATKDKDIAWMKDVILKFEASLEVQSGVSMVAVQGPDAIAKVLKVLPSDIKNKTESLERFFGTSSGEWFIGRTGYTGEDGLEIVSNSENIKKIWQELLENGVVPCGLGARDSLRLEAGMMLYGSDMNEVTTPLESGLKWTLGMSDQRDFIGKSALLDQLESGLKYKIVGLTLEGKGIMRAHQDVLINNNVVGEVTSGGYSPSLDKSIAFARVELDLSETCEVNIRKKLIPATVGKTVFFKNT